MNRIFKDVIIYRGEADTILIASKEDMPVTLNFNPDVIIGRSNVRVVDNLVYADIELFEGEERLSEYAHHIFPYTAGKLSSIGFSVEGIAVGRHPNQDPGIMTLGDYTRSYN
jgi:hypothetical protein